VFPQCSDLVSFIPAVKLQMKLGFIFGIIIWTVLLWAILGT